MLEYTYSKVIEVIKLTKKKNEKREIPTKNYIIIGIIVIITTLAAIYLCSWYKQYNDNKINEPVITSVLRQVEYNNLNTVLQERDVLIMYLCTTDEKICRNFEKKFSKYIKDNNLTEEIIYLNLGYEEDETGLLKRVYDEYKTDNLVKKIYSYPTLMIFSEGKIVDVLSSNEKDKITIEKVSEFLEGYEI